MRFSKSPSVNLHQDLSEIAAAQHADESSPGGLETINDVFAIVNAAVRDQGRQLAQELFVIFSRKFCVGNVANEQTPPHDREHRVGRPTHGRCGFTIVEGDSAARRHAGIAVKQRQDNLPDRPADILGVKVDPIGTCTR
jgi:hypothetical protein